LKNDAETRARVLKTAERLFGERGFKMVTVREICKAAQANVAAVNYHFGDKMGLYREVLQGAIDAMRETNEAAREAGKGQPPEEQLCRFIHVFLHRVLKPGHEGIHRLITREMNDPTPALDTLVEQGVRPRIEYLSGVISQILECDPRDERVLRCLASVQAQAVAYFPNPIAARLGFRFKPTPAQIDKAARHVATFSIAGVRAVGRAAG
jgi:TetR/AcrR family transcriptional regulator, regulator of cefoperazone and chloramphenicol sensitivity